MKVLLPTFDSPATLQGGVEWYVHHLAKSLTDEGHEVRVLARKPRSDAKIPAGVDYEWVWLPPSSRTQTHRYRMMFQPLFARGVRQHSAWADVVHGQNRDAEGALGARPVVATVHTTPVDEWASSRLGGWREALYQRRLHEAQLRAWRRFAQGAAHLWTPSPEVADSLRGLGARSVEVMANPILPVPRHSQSEARARLDLPATGPIVLYLGRLAPVKRVDRLLQALATMPQVHGVVAGHGPEEANLRREAMRLGIDGRVRFLGRVDDDAKALLLSATDVVCLPSEHEGQPLVLLEALQSGARVVATKADWVPADLRPYGLWGEDTAALLADALKRGRHEGAPVQGYPDVARRVSATYVSVVGAFRRP